MPNNPGQKSSESAPNDDAANKDDQEVNQSASIVRITKALLAIGEGGAVVLVFWLYSEFFGNHHKSTASNFFWVFAVSAACTIVGITAHKHWPHKVVISVLVIAASITTAIVAYEYGTELGSGSVTHYPELPLPETTAALPGVLQSPTSRNGVVAKSRGAVDNDASTTLPDDRIVVTCSPEYLCNLFDDRTSGAEERVAPYLGKWITAKETVFDIIELENGELYLSLQTDPNQIPRVHAIFSKHDWQDKLNLMKPGNSVTVFGRIDEVDSLGMTLKDCELK